MELKKKQIVRFYKEWGEWGYTSSRDEGDGVKCAWGTIGFRWKWQAVWDYYGRNLRDWWNQLKT